MVDVLEQLATQNEDYHKDAFYYVAKAIESAHEAIRKDEQRRRHISGGELVKEMVKLVKHDFGYLGATVLTEWGIVATDDIGKIVFLMVENGVLSAQESDSIDDFKDLFDLKTVLEHEYDDFRMES